jgi:cytochrome c553
MKKYLGLAVLICLSVILFSNCHSAKKSMAKNTTPKITYSTNVRDVVAANCSPCHIPEKGGNKTPLDTYDKLKANIDSVIRRIGLNPGDKGFMPFKRAKLSDSTIAIFTQWRDAGTPE